MTRAVSLVVTLALAGCSAVGVTTSSSTGALPAPSTTIPPSTTTTEPPFVTVNGAIVGPGGRVVAGVTVEFGDASGVTDHRGRFTLTTSQPGPIHVSKSGWSTLEIAWGPGTGLVSGVIHPITIRGLRVGAGAAGDDAQFQYLLDLADHTAVNALVFDTKQEGGEVLYETGVGLAYQISAVDPWYDPVRRISQAKEAGLYTITRIVVFEDVLWVVANPEEKLAGPWADPRSVGARAYNIELAKEACALGFDEVQLDYVRFPAGRTATVSGQLDLPETERVAAIESFLAEARAAVQPMGCSLSADIFAIVVSTNDDQGLGQRPEELSAHLDALSPMIYPSHYSLGWLGFPDPNDYPYEVTANAIDAALGRIDPGSVLRPWLQGFWWSDDQIRLAIRAAEDRGVGWILWNVGSDFHPAALPRDDEVD
ncbi:MAG: hypothetical protein L0Z63_08145 [Actinobacteria bacterium]|nr:hypothetical protein [Actinomycetota bacterium]